MASGQDKDSDNGRGDLEKPFIPQERVVSYGDDESNKRSTESGSIGMVLLSTFVAVCGSFEFGSCVSMFDFLLWPTFSAKRAT